MIELRWLSRGGQVEPWDAEVRAGSGLKMKLQYRVGSPRQGVRPIQDWSEWKDVPVVHETEVADEPD